MKMPKIIHKLIDGTAKIDPRDLLPRRLSQLRHRLAAPLVPHSRALHYSRCLALLGHDPQKYSLPPLPSSNAASDTVVHGESLSYVPLALRRVQRELPGRLAKINFIRAQKAKMPQIIAEWREKKRANRLAKQKKYPF